MNPPERPRTLIGIRAALTLYAVLVVIACVLLKGKALYLALIIVFAVAAKTLLHYARNRIE
jgi:uncharacterized membrane protein YiaA